jgi:hypothetical protein
MSETATATTALAVVEPEKKGRAISLRATLNEQSEMRAIVKEFIEKHMVEDVDYGVIPGTSDKTLLKPGAEKLIDLFRCTPQFKLMKCEEDFERGFFNYIFRVRLISRDAGQVVAEGFGSANSYEGKYRWRDAKRKCPKCGKATIIKGKEEYGGGWVCWAKDGTACKAKFTEDAPEIVSQVVSKVENDDIATQANTILKMGKKRCLVDGAIGLARCSDLFTQDAEDMAPEDVRRNSPPKQQQPRGSRVDEVTRQVANQRKGPKSAPARQNEPPPHADGDGPPHDPQTGEVLEPPLDGPKVPYGRQKDVHVTKLSTADLEWYSANPPEGAPQFLGYVRAELYRRKTGQLPLESAG